MDTKDTTNTDPDIKYNQDLIMCIKESMDTTDIKDTTETMAIPALEYPGTVLGRPVLE